MKKLTTSQFSPSERFIVRSMTGLSALILAILPFHAFITVWGSTLVGNYTLLRLWKECILAVLLIGAAVLAVNMLRAEQDIRAAMRRQPLLLLIGAYIILLAGSGAASVVSGAVTPKAFAYGLLLDSRFLIFFIVTWLVARRSSWLVDHWRQLLLLPAAIVVVFGLLQATLLPADFLRHFGYGADTIDAVQTIDQKSTYQRIQSTLRGANPFGAYLIIIISALAVLASRASPKRWLYIVSLAAACAALAMTFSRSAWLGTTLALAWLTWWSISSNKVRKGLLIGGSLLCMLLLVAGYALRDNDVFQNTILHTDENSRSASSSNEGHLTASRDGLIDILRQPQGGGTGSAGPASAYNDSKPARIAENYYLQLGQEAGVIGMLLFAAINLLVAQRLWQRRHARLPQILLASLVGISLVALLSHVWTDDTLSYVWWGLAGAAIGGIAVRRTGSRDVS
ncbi:MAG TPA: O-antigen ligase family protein [Candidatus Saccharimonadales bacterium]|jgi:hypothetical protein